MNALELIQVYKKQQGFLLKDINFEVKEDSVFAICGRAGSGKSTLVSLIGNAIEADSGIIKYFGHELYEDEKNIRNNMAIVYSEPNFNIEMRANTIAREIKRFEPDFDMDKFQTFLEKYNLDGDARVRTYSRHSMSFFKVILSICRCPKLMVLDEPTTGLDDEGKEEMWQLINEYKWNSDVTVIFTTHHKSEAVSMADNYIALENGGIV